MKAELPMNDYLPNNNASYPLEFEPVIQWLTIILFPILNKHHWDCSLANVDWILMAIADMAYDFHKKYENTKWETTFLDYLVHFAYNNIDRYFEDSYGDEGFEKTFIKIQKDIKKSPYWV